MASETHIRIKMFYSHFNEKYKISHCNTSDKKGLSGSEQIN